MNIEVNKPNLFVIGASKCATTSLWAILKDHPDIFMSLDKEPSFFVKESFNNKLLSYLALFEAAKNQKFIGEASPVYSETTTFPDTAKRIYDFNPEAKIIYIVREPIDRLKSVWKQTLHSGHWLNPVYEIEFEKKSIGLMPINFDKALYEYPPFLESTKYWTHLSSYRKYFKDENILLLFYEDLKKDQSIINRQIFNFLGLEEISNKSKIHVNKSNTKRRFPFWFRNLSPKTQSQLKHSIPPAMFHKLIKRPVNNIRISPGEKEKIYSILENEISSILEYGGKSEDFWRKDRS